MQHRNSIISPSIEEYLVVIRKADNSYKSARVIVDIKKPFPNFIIFPRSENYSAFSTVRDFIILDDTIEYRGSVGDDPFTGYIQKFYKRGLEQVTPSLLAIRKQIKPWLRKNYSIVPNQADLTEWYGQNKLLPHIHKNIQLMWIGEFLPSGNIYGPISTFGTYLKTSYPEPRPRDLQEYCIQYNKELLRNNQQLLQLLNPSEGEAEAGTYDWLGSYTGEGNMLDDLYLRMNGKYIECSLEEFRAVFGKAKFVYPIVWKSDKVSHLIYFIKQLQQFGYLAPAVRQNWQLLQKLFIKSSGEVFQANFNVLAHKIERKVSQEFKEDINKIISSLDD